MKNAILISLSLMLAAEVFADEKQQAAASREPDILFLMGGQSNMAGNGNTASLPKTEDYRVYLDPPANVSIWDANQKKWVPLTPGKRFGPEIGFAHALSKTLTSKHIGIVKYAVGGTSMDRWKPGGELYSRLLGDFAEAQKSVPNAKLKAMLWHQGESDTDEKEIAEAYRGKFIELIKSIRADTNQADLLFICGQINPGDRFRGVPRFMHADIVRKTQEELDLPNYLMIKTDDCEKNRDNLHYSAKGQIKMGERFAEAYLKQSK